MDKPEPTYLESARLAALKQLELLDTPADNRFDRITRLALRCFQVPFAIISLIDAERVWFLSRQDLDIQEIPRSLSFCTHTIVSDTLLYCPDTRQDPRFADNPLVTDGPFIRFYAGYPLHGPNGERIAAFALLSDKTRELSESEQCLLRDLADCAEAELANSQLFAATEQQWQDNEAYIRSILQTALDGIITLDDQGAIQRFNPAAEKIFGYAAQQTLGKNISQLLPALQNLGQTGLRSYLKKASGDGHELSGVRKDGSLFPVELALSEMPQNKQRMFTVIVKDISENKMMELAFKRYDAIIRYSDDAIISKNLHGNITSWNEGAEKMYGYTAIEAVGKPMLELFPPDKEIEEYNILQKLLHGEKAQHYETVRRRKDGSLIDISVTISPLINDEGEITGVSNIARDITENKRLERMKSEFISTVSHELRTPLTSIRGALDLVLGKSAAQLPDKARKMLEMAARNSERLTLLINDILDLEKIESGRIDFEFKYINLVPLAQRALEDNEGYAHRHQVTLQLATSGLTQAPVYGDQHRILQVFANLISNAVKFSPQQGQVEIGISDHEGGYRVSVTDHGQGIPKEFRSRIFQRFAQADSSDTREKGGTGLGLSITKAIVERHNGSINYISELGEGTQFYFDLPAAQTAMCEDSDTATDARVLVCEDNLDVATILAEMVRLEGIHCDIAMTAAAARTLLAEGNYRLLLLDLTLPDEDGLLLLQDLRADPKTRQLPVIVVSGRAMEGRSSFNGSTLTVADWLQKPVDQERFRNSVHHVLQRHEQPRILHVEDNPDVIQIVQSLLENSAEFHFATSLSEARQLLANNQFDLVILDLGLADGSGAELLDGLKNQCPVVIFSAQTIGREISERVNAALTKSMTSNEQLLSTIKKTLRGQ